jgi:hypothetical protein
MMNMGCFVHLKDLGQGVLMVDTLVLMVVMIKMSIHNTVKEGKQ